MQISGKTALVTGGGSGLGAATARRLAAEGALVIVVDRDADAATAVAQEVGGIAATADVTDETAIANALNTASATPQIIVNCAGIGTAARVVGREGPMSLDAFRTVINVNLVGTFNVCRLAAARMAEAGLAGTIVNTASVAAFEGQIGQAAYAASKGGIVSLGLPMAREFARFGIRVNTIAPGIFVTPLLGTLPQEAQTALAAGIPYPSRLGEPDEFARTVQFCVEMDYLNGEVIRLDGATRLAPK
ncbi:SDR family NAD(P)-dependent oxidoreductase [Marivita sp.]|uniref:SDR family NAD(P)-dependent oxidoreductase n=1 Tax=Marivita sp. TaxID=2003365 RepID=UPI0025C65309|nr:SDR family NAD(P)-dependent oxidoreductase [Marivita sp.]